MLLARLQDVISCVSVASPAHFEVLAKQEKTNRSSKSGDNRIRLKFGISCCMQVPSLGPDVCKCVVRV